MSNRLHGKTALITSAAQGIGRATALAMAREGAKVYATDINEDLLKTLTKDHAGIEVFTLNVLDGDAILAAAARITAPDILFNCAGFVHHGTVVDVSDKDWDFSFDLNVKSHFRMIRAFMPAFLERGSASIINMASVASSIKGVPNRVVYGASKAAVIGLTKALAADYTPKGIRVNAICPGTVETPSLYERMKAQGDFEKAKAAFVARQPMGRLAQPDE
ncbi:MAG: SDR family oxidoreductase, partial [Alphaproteobacteria bacterium]|nr:SDR family oxidoreductase [Alphaproteobacteria bacterium]